MGGDKPGREAAQKFSQAWNRHFRSKRQVSVERLLVWTYKEQRVIEIGGRGLYAGEVEKGERWIKERAVSGDGCVAIEQNALVGCQIDGGGPVRGIPQPLHEDAETVHEIVLSMPWATSGQLVNYGRTGIAPELPSEPKLVRVVEFNGKRRKVKIRSHRDFILGCEVKSCPVVIDVDQRSAEYAKAVFDAWIEAMESLLVRLHDVELREHEVVGIAATMSPADSPADQKNLRRKRLFRLTPLTT